MQNAILSQNITIPLSLCDDTAHLSVFGALSLFQDYATRHSEILGAGFDTMAQSGQFWMALRITAVFHEMPRLNETVTLKTWPNKPRGPFCNRNTTLQAGDKTLVECVTEWLIFDTVKNRIARPSREFLDTFASAPETLPMPEKVLVDENFDEAQTVDTYKIRSTDIDVGHHMNNAAYIRTLLGSFTTSQLREKPIASIQISYKNQCREGETLHIARRPIENGWQVGLMKEDNTAGVLAHIVLRENA